MAQTKRPNGTHMFLAGMTRSGKSEAASRWAADKPRVLVWDPQADWVRFGFDHLTSLSAVAEQLREHAQSPARISFRGRAGDRVLFGQWCQMAYLWGQLTPCLAIVEELAWVTDPGKAPAGWLELVTGALKYGIDIASITQRPSESDKTALSQATIVRCFQTERVNDQKYMAGELGVEPEKIAALEPLHYIEKDRRARKLSTGVITF